MFEFSICVNYSTSIIFLIYLPIVVVVVVAVMAVAADIAPPSIKRTEIKISLHRLLHTCWFDSYRRCCNRHRFITQPIAI